MIQLHSLCKSYGKQAVLKDITLNFSEGNVYGFVGKNGAGKTTLFRCIAGLESYEGSIQASTTPLKNHLGLLTTEPYFLPKITAKEHIRLLGMARGKKLSTASIEAKNIFDLPLNAYASTYSTGMKKKLALTAILLQENKYYILDEPFNGVDIESATLITQLILELKSLNKIVLLSSHIFSTLNDTCDQICLLEEGLCKEVINKDNFDDLNRHMNTYFAVQSKIQSLNLH